MGRRGGGILMIMIVGEIKRRNNVVFRMIRGDNRVGRGLKFCWGEGETGRC